MDTFRVLFAFSRLCVPMALWFIRPIRSFAIQKAGRRSRMEKLQEQQYITDAKGEKLAVIIPLEVYEKLLEDLHDLAIVAERRGEETIPLEEVKQRLSEDGLL